LSRNARAGPPCRTFARSGAPFRRRRQPTREATYLIIGSRLHELPTADLRRLFDALQLTVTFHHEKEADIEIVLQNGLANLDSAQVCPVLLTGDYSNPESANLLPNLGGTLAW